MDADIGCSISLTSLPTNAWRPVSPARSKQSMSSTFCPTCSSCAAFPVTSGPTTDLSSSPRLSKLGSPLSAPRLPISSGAVLGRTATSRASTPAFAMSCSMARSSTPSEKLRKLAAPLQYDQAACLARLQATSTRGVPARLGRVAGCAARTGSDGHAGATANLKLTFHLDHLGANQSAPLSSQVLFDPLVL